MTGRRVRVNPRPTLVPLTPPSGRRAAVPILATAACYRAHRADRHHGLPDPACPVCVSYDAAVSSAP